MPANDEFRCFVGGLPWSTTDKGLEDTFRQFGSILEAKVITDRDTGRSRGFGFVTFGDQRSMDEAIDRLHGKELEGRPITVNKAMPKLDDENGDRGYDDYRGRGSYGRGSAGGNGDCFRCGRPGHWARDCPEGGRLPSRDQYPSRGDRYESDRHYGGGSDYSGRYGERSDRYEDRYHSGDGYRREGRSGGAYRERDAYRRNDRSNGGGPIRYDGGYRDRPAMYDRPVNVRGRSSYDRY